jgi:hypothetical protein
LEQVDVEGSESEFVSVADSQRDLFHKHPWSIGGGGASELKERLDSIAFTKLGKQIETISSICLTREDDAYLIPQHSLAARRISSEFRVISVQGEQVRDWSFQEPATALFPYDSSLNPISHVEGENVHQFLWPYKEYLWRRKELGGDHRQLGRTWWEWNRFLSHWYQIPKSIAFAFVATHNHFVLDRGGKVFNRSAPVIKLPAGATEDDHLALLGLLNSSTACFWMKQVFFPKGGDQVGNEGARIRKTLWDERYEFAGTGLQEFPVTSQYPLERSKQLDNLAQRLK